MMASQSGMMLDADEVTLRMPIPDGVHHWLGKLHDGT